MLTVVLYPNNSRIIMTSEPTVHPNLGNMMYLHLSSEINRLIQRQRSQLHSSRHLILATLVKCGEKRNE